MSSRVEILDFIKRNGVVTEEQVQREFGLHSGNVLNRMKFYKDKKGIFLLGLAIRHGNGSQTKEYKFYFNSEKERFATKKEIKNYTENGRGKLVKVKKEIVLYPNEDFVVYCTEDEKRLEEEGIIGKENLKPIVPDNIDKIFLL
jgi:hypothetical protein